MERVLGKRMKDEGGMIKYDVIRYKERQSRVARCTKTDGVED